MYQNIFQYKGKNMRWRQNQDALREGEENGRDRKL